MINADPSSPTGTLTATRAVAAVLLGPRGTLWLLLSVACWLAQGLVEWGMAGLLLLFLSIPMVKLT